MTANKIKHDTTVDMASRLAGCDPEVGKVDLSHLRTRTSKKDGSTFLADTLEGRVTLKNFDFVRGAN